MSKKLSEMSLEELWELFPVILTEHQSDWNKWYSEEKKMLQGILPEENVARMSHIGSTVIDNIWAKPIIDILVEVTIDTHLQNIKEILTFNGYTCMSQSDNTASFNKGYTENGFAERVFHLHLRYVGDNNELYFRDYMMEHPEVAKEYERLKLDLWNQYKHDRDGYTNAKSEFVTRYTKEAKKVYGDKYY